VSVIVCVFSTPVVGLSPDESTVICWHPEVPFPYEHTLVGLGVFVRACSVCGGGGGLGVCVLVVCVCL
jgi:hypothetical protein